MIPHKNTSEVSRRAQRNGPFGKRWNVHGSGQQSLPEATAPPLDATRNTAQCWSTSHLNWPNPNQAQIEYARGGVGASNKWALGVGG